MADARSPKKRRKLREVARAVQAFYPELTGIFICPTCLRHYPISRPKEISNAHILPRAAKGTIKTYLCRSCNSRFGAGQDKWFAEYLNTNFKPNPVMSATHQDGSFTANGLRVNGRYEVAADGTLQFLIYDNRNSPQTIKQALAIAERERLGGSLEIRFGVPILRNKQLIESGFATAAYLLCFHELGYSWVLQQHLDPVRQQILHPQIGHLPKSFLSPAPGLPSEPPWIGIGYWHGGVAVVAVLGGCAVLFPPPGTPDFYDAISDQAGLELRVRRINFNPQLRSIGPVSMLFGSKPVVLPDTWRSGQELQTIYFPTDGSPPRAMSRITDAEYEKLREHPGAVEMRVDVVQASPKVATGREDADKARPANPS